MSISKTIITTVLALAMVAVVAPSAMALTAGCSLTNTATCNLQDLTTLISGLTSQLTSLQGTSGTTGAGACVGVTFTRNLYVGNTGSDVSCLQQIVGSTVVGTYGPNTKAHVVTFQTAHGITATGSVGPRTIAALTLAMGGSTGAGAGSGSGSTGLCPNGMTLASNCTTGANNTPVGGIGFLSIPELAATPASNANVTTTTNVPVLGVDVKAIGSDMVVNSAKVQLAATKNSAVEHPATTVQALYVYDGSTKIGTYPVNTTTVIKDGSSYYVILSGFSFRVPGNTTRTLTINADFAPSLETSRVLKVALYGTTDAIGATDGSGVNRSAGLDASLSSGIPTANYKQYTVAYATVNTSTLAATANTSTPVAASVKIDSTNGTTDVPMLVFDTKSTTGASVITDVTVTATGDAAGIAAVNAVKLYDGNTLLGSLSLTAAKAHFTNLTINVPQDATKTLTVKADLAVLATSDNGKGVIFSIADPTDATYGILYNKPNLTSTAATGSAITGKEMYLYNGKAAVLTLASPLTSAYSYNATTPTASNASGTITFNAKGDGAALTKLATATVKVKACNSTACYASGSTLGTIAEDVTVSPNTDTSPDGTTATVTVNASISRGTNSGYVWFEVYEIDWSVGGVTASQDWGLTDYRTPSVNMY